MRPSGRVPPRSGAAPRHGGRPDAPAFGGQDRQQKKGRRRGAPSSRRGSSLPVASLRRVGRPPWRRRSPLSSQLLCPPSDATTSANRNSNSFGAAFPQVLAAAQVDAPWAYQRLFEWLGRPVAGTCGARAPTTPRASPMMSSSGCSPTWGASRATRSASAPGCSPSPTASSSTSAGTKAGVPSSPQNRARRPRRLLRLPPSPTSSPDSGPSVTSLLGALSPDQRDVLLLRIVADLTVEQVSEALGKAPGAVQQLQRRGLTALRRRLDGGVDQGDSRRTLSRSYDVHPR